MQVSETLAEGLKRELKVVIPATDLATRLDEYLNDMKSKVNINGFRPGKVPVSHLKKVHGRQAMGELIGNLINETTAKTIEERKEKPALQPEIDLSDDDAEKVLAGEADLAYTISYEVLPQFDIVDFSAIELERPIVEISEDEVDEQVKQIAESNRPFEAREEGAAAEDGDRVTMHYLGKLDGEPFEGGEDENGQLVLGSGQFIPGFEEQIVGLKIGDKKVIDVTFPEEYGAANLAGRAVTFDIDVKGIEAAGEVSIDDEMATKLGLESLEKLKEIVRGQIESQFGAATRQKVKRALLDKLDEEYSFELPEKLLETEFDGVWKQVEADMQQSGKTFEDEETTEDEAKAEYRKISERRVRLGLVLSEVGEQNKVQVTDEEVQKALFDRVRQFPGQEQQVFEFYKNNEQALASLRAPIYEEKVVDYILELAKVSDKVVSKEELMAQDEDEA
ncbi:Trigger factor [Pseudovibrio sp. W64]|uniref:trigger factor n=1 Tax=unclassified Pseudovibrio TaxID=2627060 RepID=UPI0007AE9A27|nr:MULTISPECIES: trigger factor [unclassified Pseudovibrio]KZK76248.1 Trigger factor [Pseudovibrio sp. W64]KZK82086.1 Trigger factor [Pseudovibrio sp. Ad13]KZK96495.1 Trigger factor [Pseudovibrio sp. Ad5]KZL26569.1 Trigger factor [Pseudovibrio sp. WM33]